MSFAAAKKKDFWGNFLEIGGLLLIVFIIRSFVFGLYQVPTGSMETSMLVGERFYADKFFYLFRDPVRGEIIAFNEPPAFYNYSDNPLVYSWQKYVYGPSNWTKRVIGVPGDTIRGTIENDKPVLYRNGEKLEELYLNKYPLIQVWRDDPQMIVQTINKMFQPLQWSGIDQRQLEIMKEQELYNWMCAKSYDPAVSFANQPFYRMNPAHVVRDETGALQLMYPATPNRTAASENVTPEQRAERQERQENYWDGSDEFFIKLGSDEYWAMGDNRKGSKDSRVFGPIKRGLIHGRILFRIWSVDSDESWWILDLLKHPIDFWNRVRWGRFFQWVY